MASSRRVPLSWQPTLEHLDLARDLRIDLSSELDKFRDFEFRYGHSDWDATFRNWLRKAAEITPRQTRRTFDSVEDAITAYKASRAAAAEPIKPRLGAGLVVIK